MCDNFSNCTAFGDKDANAVHPWCHRKGSLSSQEKQQHQSFVQMPKTTYVSILLTRTSCIHARNDRCLSGTKADTKNKKCPGGPKCNEEKAQEAKNGHFIQ